MIYTFQCNSCGKQFEVKESLAEHERHQEKCPECDSQKVARHIDNGVQVKTSKKS